MKKKRETAYTRYRRNLLRRIRQREKQGWIYVGQKPLTEKQLRKQGVKLIIETRKIKKRLKEFEKEEFVTEWGEIFSVKEIKKQRVRPTLPDTTPNIIDAVKKRISALSGSRVVNNKGRGNRAKYIDLDGYASGLLRLIEYAEEVTDPLTLASHYIQHEEQIFNALDVIAYDSDQGSIESAFTLILGILKNAPINMEEAIHLEELAEEAWDF